MKILFFLTLLFSAQTVSAQGLESFCRTEKNQRTCLSSFLTYKCISYKGITNSLNCAEASGAFIKALDLGASPKLAGDTYQEEVIFKTDLVKMVGEPATKKFLENLKSSLEEKLSFNESFQLWDEVNKLSANPDESIKRLAILFQDASESPRHISYLKSRKLSTIGKQSVAILEEVLTYFSLPALKELSNIKVYPMEYEGSFNQTFYHFYTMAYASKKLVAAKMDKKMAFFIPFMFNTQYEFKAMKGWPLMDPKKGTKISDWKVKEIYAGYIGSLAGTKSLKSALKLKEFTQRLKIDPSKFVQELGE